MLNVIWVVIMLASLIYAFASGNAENISDGLFAGAESCISFVLKTGSFMILWQGLLSIAQKSSLSEKISALMAPVLCAIFENIKRGSRELSLISNNITANILGLSNAATPLGIAAMQELGKKSVSGKATNNMCLLAVINSASLQLIPSTLIAMRSSFNSSAPGEIIVPVWIVSSLTLTFAVLMSKFFQRRA